MTRRLYTVAFPAFAETGTAFVDRLRARRDAPQRAVIGAHFTLVFGCAALPEADYLAHVRRVAGQTGPIGFHCRYAMLGADDENDTAYVFLVPDEGHAALSLLHDALYSGALAEHLRLDLPYTPHIRVGSSPDRHRAKAWCDALNRKGVDLRGAVQTLTVGSIEQGRFAPIAELPLDA